MYLWVREGFRAPDWLHWTWKDNADTEPLLSGGLSLIRWGGGLAPEKGIGAIPGFNQCPWSHAPRQSGKGGWRKGNLCLKLKLLMRLGRVRADESDRRGSLSLILNGSARIGLVGRGLQTPTSGFYLDVYVPIKFILRPEIMDKLQA